MSSLIAIPNRGIVATATAIAGADAIVVVPARDLVERPRDLIAIRWSYNNVPTGASFLQIDGLAGESDMPVTAKFDITTSGYDFMIFADDTVSSLPGQPITITLKDGGTRKHLFVCYR